MTDEEGRRAVVDRLRAADRAFAAGDADAWAACFAEDGRLLQMHNPELIGPAAIAAHWRRGFARFDTSAWEPEIALVEVIEDHAHALTTYTERLLDRQDGSRTLVRGRLVWWLRRGGGGDGWRVTLLMNSHAHPMEPIE